jgi:hypothetical protein
MTPTRPAAAALDVRTIRSATAFMTKEFLLHDAGPDSIQF